MSDEDAKLLYFGASKCARLYGGQREDWLGECWIAMHDARATYQAGSGKWSSYVLRAMLWHAIKVLRKQTKYNRKKKFAPRIDSAAYLHYQQTVRSTEQPDRHLLADDVNTILGQYTDTYAEQGKFYLAQNASGKSMYFMESAHTTPNTRANRLRKRILGIHDGK